MNKTRTASVVVAAVILGQLTGWAAEAALPPIEKVELVSQEQGWRVNGQPFFPIMSWLQKPESFKMLRELGINTFCGDQKGTAVQCDAAKEAGGYAVAHFKEGEKAGPYLLSWIQGDEPDMPAKSDGGIWEPKSAKSVATVLEDYTKIKSADATRPVLMTFTGNFMKEQRARYDEAKQKEIYGGYVKAADVLGFDFYPLYGHGTFAYLNYPAYGTEQLREYAGAHKPVYAWIEANRGSRWMSIEKQPEVLPAHTRFEVWGCIIRGATAIGYFTHAWKPSFTEFAPSADMRAELKRLNLQITRLAPAILAPADKTGILMSMPAGVSCHFKSTRTSSDLLIIAQVTDLGPDGEKKKQFEPISPRGGKAAFAVPGLKAGTQVEVVDEGRSIAAEEGSFSDGFEPLTTHLYRIKLK